MAEERRVYQELVQLEYQEVSGLHVEQSLVQLEYRKYRVKPSDGLMIVFNDKS
jgi:hypothetical protein